MAETASRLTRVARAVRFPLRCTIYVLLVAFAVLAHACTAARFTGVEEHEGGWWWKSVELPYSTPAASKLEFRAHMHVSPLGVRSLAIVPDDHMEALSIDGVDVPLAGIPAAKLSDWRFGFTVSVAPYVHAGDNVVVVRVRNEGGAGGLDMHADPSEWINVVEFAVGLAALLALTADLMRRFGVPWPTVGLVLLALVVRFAYLSITPWNLRHHDGKQHLDYIEYVVGHHALPQPEQGYMFFQPPLYYVLSALQWAALKAMGAGYETILWSLQVQSLVAELGFALLSIATARIWMRRIPPPLLTAFILLWPSSILHAMRVGNDDLAYLFFAASFYFTSRWWVLGVRRDVAWASLLAAIGVVTKVNDLVAFAVLLLAIVGRLVLLERDRRVLEYARRLGMASACLGASVAASLGVAFREWIAGRRHYLLASNANQNSPLLLVGNHAKNYLWLDVPTFLAQPFTSAWDDAKGRQWFWNYLFKTSLFGEFDYANPWMRRIGIVISVLFLLLLLRLLAGALFVRSRQWLGGMPLVASALLLLAGLAMLRFTAPSSCSNDFRYILPIIVPCACAYVWSQMNWRERGWRIASGASAAVGWLFVLSCVAFFGVLAVVGD